MSTDIERLLAAAADDADQPLRTDVEDILVRARRSVRRGRIAAVSTAVLTTAAIVGGIAVWSAGRPESEGPAGTSKGQTITIDAKSGRIVDNETGTAAQAPPPVSPLSDAEVLERCKQYDNEYVQSSKERGSNTYDKTGPIDARWKVVVKSGDQNRLQALFFAPDKSIVSTCTMEGPERPKTYGRYSTTEAMPVRVDPTAGAGDQQPQAVSQGTRIPVAGVTRVLVNLAGEATARQALVGSDGFFTLGYPDWPPFRTAPAGDNWEMPEPTVQRIRGYDAGGKRVYDWKYEKVPPPSGPPPVDPEVTIKTAEPMAPAVVLTKDPETGKALAPEPPVSPESDDRIRTRCKKPDDAYFKNSGQRPAGDRRTIDAGRITPDWAVALKTGTGIDFTAVLVSPGRNVVMWCHMYEKADYYDYSRSGVQADGKFANDFNWGMVPDGVAQIVVDLPKQGPTRALISNGYYIWGLTGGNSDIKNVRVRGFDAQGKKVYDKQQQVDADFD